ncbi:MAG: T9SS type A sorting domain-containing protein [Bacteroidetes bacterium]|nr:T9SS type A sorting domain-containing protein [Bacteroidota bacterium]
MKRLFLLVVIMALLGRTAQAQTAPPHLRYFGFALIDVFWDDPHDTSAVTNYLNEVDTFSNVAHLAVYSPSDNIVQRIANMNSRCVLPMLHIQSVFFEYEDTNGPSGANYGLRSDYLSRWNQFLAINQAAITPASIGAFYIVDEPYWNGVTYAELDTVCTLLQQAFPAIPVFLVEAYTMMNQFQVPPSADWLAFDMYGIFDPPNDAQFMQNLTLLKNARTSSSQELFLIIDDQWITLYGQAGYAPDTIEYMVQNYYDLAVADTSIAGLIGYLWPGGFDEPAQLGVRNMPANVIQKNVAIGKSIKNNYNPCTASDVPTMAEIPDVAVFPSPASDVLEVKFQGREAVCTIYNSAGKQLMQQQAVNQCAFDVAAYAPGIYFVRIEAGEAVVSQKFIIFR